MDRSKVGQIGVDQHDLAASEAAFFDSFHAPERLRMHGTPLRRPMHACGCLSPRHTTMALGGQDPAFFPPLIRQTDPTHS